MRRNQAEFLFNPLDRNGRSAHDGREAATGIRQSQPAGLERMCDRARDCVRWARRAEARPRSRSPVRRTTIARPSAARFAPPPRRGRYGSAKQWNTPFNHVCASLGRPPLSERPCTTRRLIHAAVSLHHVGSPFRFRGMATHQGQHILRIDTGEALGSSALREDRGSGRCDHAALGAAAHEAGAERNADGERSDPQGFRRHRPAHAQDGGVGASEGPWLTALRLAGGPSSAEQASAAVRVNLSPPGKRLGAFRHPGHECTHPELGS